MNPRLQLINFDSGSEEEQIEAPISIQPKHKFQNDRFKSGIINKNQFFKNEEDDQFKIEHLQSQPIRKKQSYSSQQINKSQPFSNISKYNHDQKQYQLDVKGYEDNIQLIQSHQKEKHKPISKFIEENQQEIILTVPRNKKNTSLAMKIQLSSSEQDSDIQEIKCETKEHNPQSDNEKSKNKKQQSEKKQKIIRSDIVTSKRQFVETFKHKKKSLRLNIKRDKSGFNRFWTRYDITFAGDCRYLASIQKSISATSTNYFISLSVDDFQSSQNYLGRVKKGMLSNEYNIFDSTQKSTSNQGKKHKNMIGTMCFGVTQEEGQQHGPRNFLFYCLKDSYLYSDLEGASNDEISLNKLYEIPANKQKIYVFKNRKAVWCKKLEGFVMDFGNRIDKASVKNMIMQDQNSEQVLMFGRIGDDLFTLDISHPLTPFLGFGIAATVFDYKSSFYS